MSFLSSSFVGFFAVVLAVYWALPSRRAQNVLLLAASLVFYGWIHPWFLVPLLFSATVDFVAAQAIETRPESRRAWLAASVVTNLGLLAFFKYQGFFVESVQVALAAVGVDASLPTLRWMVPLGISFFTFQSLGYTVAVYRGEARARRDPIDFYLYATFFPQLVAGPIHEPEFLLPQLERPRQLRIEALVGGLTLALWGAVKKVVVADRIAADVDAIFSAPEPAFPLVVVGSVAFGVQLFADFSGYTDIARGVARMLGVELARNFDLPFVAVTTPSFWRRWHISLSRWVGKVLYEPLVQAGPRSPTRVATALMVTFLVLGLWHGASWTFVALGLFQGVAAVVYTFTWPLVPAAVRRSPVFLAAAWLVHVGLVLVPSGILFREVSLARVAGHLARAGAPVPPIDAALAWGTLGSTVAFAAFVAAGSGVARWAGERASRPWTLPLHLLAWLAAAALVEAMERPLLREFVYFRF